MLSKSNVLKVKRFKKKKKSWSNMLLCIWYQSLYVSTIGSSLLWHGTEYEFGIYKDSQTVNQQNSNWLISVLWLKINFIHICF